MTIRLRSSAKLNLSLDILNRLPNGYHELSSIVHTIGIWDELEGQFDDAGTTVQLTCDRSDLSGPDNLVLKAVNLWQKVTGEQFGLRLVLRKNIPSGAGLGGGSGNAAATLLLLNMHSPAPLPPSGLADLGAGLGADVPLFLKGGAVLMEGIGDRITPLAPLQAWVVVIKPETSLSTPSVYRAWDDGGFCSELGTRGLLELWPPSAHQLASSLTNDLERAAKIARPLAFDAAPWTQMLQEAGALGSGMTGSGSACFGVFVDEATATRSWQNLQLKLANDLHTSSVRTFVAPLTACGIEALATG